MLGKLLVGFVALASFLGPGAALAQAPCEGVPGAELPDCSFEDDPLTEWSLASGDSLGQSSEPPRSGSGSAEANAGKFGGTFDTNVRLACFPMTAGPDYGFGAWFRLVSGTPPFGCRASFTWYPDENCSSATAGSLGNEVVITTGSWIQSSGMASPVGSHAALVLACLGGGDFVVQMDDAFAGPSLVPVELQSFRVE